MMKDSCGITWRPVTRYSRARKEGTMVACSKCQTITKVYHFGWVAMTCPSCKGMIDKAYWLEHRPC